MEHRINIRFSDGETFQCKGDEFTPILVSAEAAGLTLAKDCEMGDCQTCKCKLVAGDVRLDDFAYDTLEDEEVSSGAMLSCVSLPLSDVTVEMPYSRADLLPKRTAKAKIQLIEPLGPRAIRLVLNLTEGKVLSFNSGQYVNLECDGVTRSYSMANARQNGRELEFHIALLDDGVMSARLRFARVGDSVTIHGPHGVFYLRNSEAPITMVAGGTGVGPMLSMLKSLIAEGRENHEITLCYGANTPEELGAREELLALRTQMPNLDLRYAAVSGPSGDIFGGYVTDLLAADELNGRRIYLCGPPPMVDAARELARRAGVHESAVYAEEFLPSA